MSCVGKVGGWSDRKLYIRAWVFGCAVWLFAFNGSVLAKQDMSKMPGMGGTRATSNKSTIRKRRAPKRNRKARRIAGRARRHRATTGKTLPMDMQMPPQTLPAQDSSAAPQESPKPMPMNMQGMPSPTPARSPDSQQATPMGMKMDEPAAVPSPPTQKTEMNMPGMQMPTASPSPQPSPNHMHMPMPASTPSPNDMTGMKDMENAAAKDSMDMGPLMVMKGTEMGIRVGSSATNILAMGAMGSGTSVQPQSSPTNMYHRTAGDWLLMFHYNLFAGLNVQGGPRGVTKAESANWFMPMAYHKVGPGTLQLRGMFSLEPFTFPAGGSPLLFQTGETYKGQALIDRQHPHDLFMELSAEYILPVGEKGTWFTYLGYPGEPALGPVAFMHRPSASENSSAPLAHHLQDSTHISFGVFTTGFTYRWVKLEGSIFNGREPDENRYDFDSHKWNSRSARLSIMPNANWAMQVSYGFLRSPEGQEPDTDIRRATASVQYNKMLHNGNWATAFIWGRNHTSSSTETHNLNAYTFESTVNFLDKNYLYTRLELVDKNELLRSADRALLGITDDHPSFRIGAYTLGGARDVWNTPKLSLAIGSDLTFYSKPALLDRIYGSNPVSWKLYFRVRPAKTKMSSEHAGHGMDGGE